MSATHWLLLISSTAVVAMIPLLLIFVGISRNRLLHLQRPATLSDPTASMDAAKSLYNRTRIELEVQLAHKRELVDSEARVQIQNRIEELERVTEVIRDLKTLHEKEFAWQHRSRRDSRYLTRICLLRNIEALADIDSEIQKLLGYEKALRERIEVVLAGEDEA